MTDPVRILVIDDNMAIHEDFKKVLLEEGEVDALSSLEAEMFGAPAAAVSDVRAHLHIDSAFQGREGLAMVQRALAEGRPYALAFVDVRMPPGWDGVETTGHLWQADPALQVVLCTAYSDYDWKGIVEQIDARDRLLILKKPFDNIEVLQLAHSLSSKWSMARALQERLRDLESAVAERTHALTEANHQLRQESELRQRAETKLRLSQKLEAVGQLASGIAHEINTPIAVVANGLYFLRDAFDEIVAALAIAPDNTQLRELVAEVPTVLGESIDCVARVATIIKATRDFASPERNELLPTDLNRAIQSTLLVASTRIAAVADVKTDFAALPPVPCHLAALNDVVMALLVNAAQGIADRIADRIADSKERGLITVRTAVEGGHVVVTVADDGCGIEDAIRGRVYDPFFTTRPVGAGTGQGLSVAHTIVVEQHQGTIDFDSVVGAGTTFRVRLPLQHAA